MEQTNKEQIVEEKYSWQIEQFVDGHWWMIDETNEFMDEEKIRIKYHFLKNRHKKEKFRLLKWSKIIKYEAIDGEGF